MVKNMGKLLLHTLFVLAAFAGFAPARAQVCTTICSNYIEGQCSEHTQTCTTPSAPRPSYGAIAYGRKSQAFGYSFHWDSQAEAERTAMQNCAKNASGLRSDGVV